ncbi:Hypothetical protein Ccan_22820 [Capnocytophaga canimorsus Cc5]|uniref:Uncharacterized protein n=1 Tax=Capnocytophaga canimorsus (strain 5) TaxID=860228 RepID=F9YVG3_CAPCC|nr:Hypothetical protein Ccan_22820 [Capnocytophaga canimorsus Cc5]
MLLNIDDFNRQIYLTPDNKKNLKFIKHICGFKKMKTLALYGTNHH